VSYVGDRVILFFDKPFHKVLFLFEVGTQRFETLHIKIVVVVSVGGRAARLDGVLSGTSNNTIALHVLYFHKIKCSDM
jgi:hypothetical protein